MTGVLILAGLAKMRRPSATASALRELSIPSPLAAARLLGVAEVVVGVLAIAAGERILWVGVAAAYTAFLGFVLWALADSSRVGSCGCFGREDTPVTPSHAAFNAAAAALGWIAVVDPVSLAALDLSIVEAIVAIALIAAGIAISIAALTVLPRTLKAAQGKAQPSVPEFSLHTSHRH